MPNQCKLHYCEALLFRHSYLFSLLDVLWLLCYGTKQVYVCVHIFWTLCSLDCISHFYVGLDAYNMVTYIIFHAQQNGLLLVQLVVEVTKMLTFCILIILTVLHTNYFSTFIERLGKFCFETRLQMMTHVCLIINNWKSLKETPVFNILSSVSSWLCIPQDNICCSTPDCASWPSGQIVALWNNPCMLKLEKQKIPCREPTPHNISYCVCKSILWHNNWLVILLAKISENICYITSAPHAAFCRTLRLAGHHGQPSKDR
jgi:hypothetical protein